MRYKLSLVFVALAIGSIIFAGATASANNPHLEYDPPTGNVHLFPGDADILAFNLQSDGRFNPDFSSIDFMSSTFSIPGIVDNTPESIGWVSAFAAGGNGFGWRPEHQAGANIGNIFPVGLDQTSLDGLLTNNAWAGLGTSGSFDLTIRVPEPAAVTLLLLGWMTVTAIRKE